MSLLQSLLFRFVIILHCPYCTNFFIVIYCDNYIIIHSVSAVYMSIFSLLFRFHIQIHYPICWLIYIYIYYRHCWIRIYGVQRPQLGGHGSTTCYLCGCDITSMPPYLCEIEEWILLFCCVWASYKNLLYHSYGHESFRGKACHQVQYRLFPQKDVCW